jgi:hypothetical protein
MEITIDNKQYNLDVNAAIDAGLLAAKTSYRVGQKFKIGNSVYILSATMTQNIHSSEYLYRVTLIGLDSGFCISNGCFVQNINVITKEELKTIANGKVPTLIVS